MQIPRYTILQLLLVATLAALLLGLFTAATRNKSEDGIEQVCFSPSGEYLAARWQMSGKLKVWRFRKDRQPLLAWSRKGDKAVLSSDEATFFLDDQRLVKVTMPYPSGSIGTIREFHVPSGRVNWTWHLETCWPAENYSAVAANRLYTSDPNKTTVRCYDLNDRSTQHEFHVGSKPIRGLALSGDGSTLAVTDVDGTVHVLDTTTLQPLIQISKSRHWTAVLTLDGSRLITIEQQPLPEYKVAIFDTRTASREEIICGIRHIDWIG